MRGLLGLSVSRIMLILTASGFFVALAFAGPQIWGLLQDRAKLQADATLTTLAQSIGGLTHELQKERGASAGFLSSNGANFTDVLPAQRRDSDRVIAAFLEAAGSAQSLLPRGSPAAERLDDVRAQIAALSALRRRVDALEIETLAAVGTITALNRSAIGLLPELGKQISYADAARAVQRHAILMTAKDISGLERATGAAGFARAAQNDGVIPGGLLERFNTLIQEQDVLYAIYRQIASSALAQAFADFASASATQTVDELRAIARSGDPAAISAIAPEAWFEAITQKINLIKAVEDLGARELVDETAEALQLNRALLVEMMALLAVLWFVVGLVSFLLARRVIHSIKLTSDRVVALADGDIDTEIPRIAPSDLRRITDALSVFRDHELSARAEAEKQKQIELSSVKGIERMTNAVSGGDFSTRLRLRDLQGAARIVGEGVNTILAEVERVVEDQKERDRQAKENDRLALEEQRAIAEAGARAVAELNAVVAACVGGDFSKRLRTDDKDGVLAELCDGVNRIGEVTETGLTDFMACLDAIAEGNLAHRMARTHQGIFAEISARLDRTTKELAAIVNQITHGAGSVQASSTELTAAADDLARRTEQSAASLEATSSALEALTTSVGSTATSAQEVGSTATTTETRAKSALDAATEMVTAMEGIAASSTEISKITHVIDDISFQTNLLALNAGVEAARAGDAGRGFAVVASEVRTLAQRAADAAQEINVLIAKSEGEVKAGVEIVNRSREGLESIQSSISNMTQEFLTIVDSAAAQSRGISDISRAVSEMEQTTQQNTAMFEETTAAIGLIRDEAEALTETIAHFSGISPHEEGQPHGMRHRASA
ncbi:MAG: nitrate- and nitrite sensing domain-containing protein [Pseudomonadota bacterium]